MHLRTAGLSLVLLAATAVTDARAAAEMATGGERQFKCHLLTDKGERIARFSLPAGQNSTELYRLAGTQIGDGRDAMRVKSVEECVLVATQFSRAKSRELDKNWGRE